MRRRRRFTSVSALADGDERVAPPDLGQQRFAAEHDSSVRRQQIEQAEFLIGELHVAPLDADSATRGSISTPWT